MLERGKERIAIRIPSPRDRCASCTKTFASGSKMEVTVYVAGSLHTVHVCHYCLGEHVPEALAEVRRDQPRRFT
jgi:RNase P subunit RPR2